jgi:hypothetical protein
MDVNSRSLVMGTDLEDTVGVNLKRDLDLGNTALRGGDTSQLELAQKVVILGQQTLTLEDLDEDRRLVIRGSREDLELLGRDDSVAGDEFGEDTSGGLDTRTTSLVMVPGSLVA